MANIQDVQTFFFLGDTVQIKISFRDKIANAPVNVLSPSLVLWKDGEVFVPTYLRNFSPTGAKDGEYLATIISDKLIAGNYRVIATGFYPDVSTNENKIVVEGEFEIYNADSPQMYIQMLRVSLADDIPSRYLIDDNEKFRWDDGQLYTFLRRAVSYFNETPPVSMGSSGYTVSNFPYTDVMLMVAEFYALNSVGLLEIFNTIQYNDDTSFSIDRYPKLQTKMETIKNLFQVRIPEMKADIAWRSTGIIGIKSTRLPLRALRSMSMSSPYLSMLSNSSGY